jgi:hypothetical protein
MLKKITLLLFIFCIIFSGFAQKSKRKTTPKVSEIHYFEMFMEGCLGDTLTFSFIPIDPTFPDSCYTFYWYDTFTIEPHSVDTFKFQFPIDDDEENPDFVTVFLYFEISCLDTVPIFDTISKLIYLDHIKNTIDAGTVCMGRDFTITNEYLDTTFYNVMTETNTKWIILPGASASGCDSLIRWRVSVDDYITEKYEISSCDSIIWGDIIIRKPPQMEGDITDTIKRIYFATDPDASCDTLRILYATIIDTAKLEIVFDQDKFCSGDDMEGTMNLETNFTAFDWLYRDKDSTFTRYSDSISFPIEEP